MTISVLGGGAWGTALAHMIAGHRGESLLWARSSSAVEEINGVHRNSKYLAEIALHPGLKATADLARACEASIVLCVTPAQSFAELLARMKPALSHQTKLVLCAKGIDQTSGRFMHELALDIMGEDRCAALTGPSFASDVARDLPTAVSLAAANIADAKELARVLSGPSFRIYATDDLIGVEVGGALKNVLALAVGIARGLKLGASAEAALIARGFAELGRIAASLGARGETLSGLSGLGDLVLTCSSPQSRNFSYGIALAQGDELSGQPLAEGVHSAASALRLAHQHGIETPIIEAVTAVLDGVMTASEAARSLLARPLKQEMPS